MDINWIRIKPVVKELRSINRTLIRIADALEADLLDRQIPIASNIPVNNDPPDFFITNEEEDYVREMEEALKQQQGKSVDPED